MVLQEKIRCSLQHLAPKEDKIFKPGDISVTQTFPLIGENYIFSVWYGAALQPTRPNCK